MLQANHITKAFGARPLLRDLSFVVHDGETLGVVGPNGAGKSTLLRLLAGELAPDRGHVDAPGEPRIAVLRQGYAGRERDAIASVFPALFGVSVRAARLAEAATRLATAADAAAAARAGAEYDALLAAMESDGDGAAEAPWDELSLRPLAPETPVGSLSGGELTKLGLLAIVAARPGVLLLDEPTNHLDTAGAEWTERYLAAFGGPAVVVSHDRALLDTVADRILALDPSRDEPPEIFTGGYSDYADEQDRRRAEQWAAYGRQRREERRVKRQIAEIETRGRSWEQRFVRTASNRKSVKVARRAVTQKARLERQIASADHVERPVKAPGGFYGAFAAGERTASTLATVEAVTLVVGGRTLVVDASFTVRRGERVVLTGGNGSGKTTLLRALLGDVPPAGGRVQIAPSARVGYLAQAEAALRGDDAATPLEIVRRASPPERPLAEEDAFNFLHRFLFGHDQARAPLRTLSYGERRRLELARLVLGGAGLLLLDEPTNHLDLAAREAFEHALVEFGGGALIVTHDRYFIDRFADAVWAIDRGHLRAV
ncbi:MAG: ABC-F family ATP-binding cassette domain-containing protein [Chloroflexi bacterium]|nr:ABC-F family ATP-binding cassette domain-containing protein [Chloroflexota bacterium]MDA1003260.1 ABC-F family ATP-binding cassette domain-containing protein [Chloroflexota bacterium]